MLSSRLLRRAVTLSSMCVLLSRSNVIRHAAPSLHLQFTHKEPVLHTTLYKSIRWNSSGTTDTSNSTHSCTSDAQTTTKSSISSSSKKMSMSPSMGKGNYFAFFDLPKQPDLDVTVLQKLYHDLQRKVHPDQENVQSNTENVQSTETTSQTEEQKQQEDKEEQKDEEGSGQRSDEDISSYANAAYETLRDPFKRCRYLSRLCTAQANKGEEPLTITEEEELASEDDRRSLANKNKVSSDMLSESFLSEILAMHELIFFSDHTDEAVRKQLVLLRADLKERDAGYYKDCIDLWANQDLDNFHYTVMKWTYVHNALLNLIQKM